MLVKGSGRCANGGMFRVQKGCLASVKPGVKSFCPPPMGGVLEQPVDNVDWGDGGTEFLLQSSQRSQRDSLRGRRGGGFQRGFLGLGLGGSLAPAGVGCSPLLGGRKAWKLGPCAPCRGRGGGVRRPCRGGSMRSSTSPRVPAGKPRLHPWLQAATPSGLEALEATPCIYSAFLSLPSRTSYFQMGCVCQPHPCPSPRGRGSIVASVLLRVRRR